MQKRVYVETSIISYLTARPSRDLIVAAHQEINRQWCETERAKHELCASKVVLREARAGGREAAEQRIDFLKVFNFLEINAEIDLLTREILERGAMSRQAALDALHVAVAAWHGVDYLLTWNCRHIASAHVRPHPNRRHLSRPWHRGAATLHL